MIRIIIEIVFFFLLPTLLYVIWFAFSHDEWNGLSAVLSEAPLVRLFLAGGALVLGTLVAFSSRTYHNPNDVYVPASVVDGKLEPARSVHEPETPQQTVKP